MTNILFVEEIGKAFVPKNLRPDLRRYFLKAGITEVPYAVFGMFFWLSFFVMAVIYIFFISQITLKLWPNAILFFAATAAIWAVIHTTIAVILGLCIYFYIDLIIFNRTMEMERVLPDFLRYVAENLRGGMPFERALWSAIRPEFSILSNEVRLAAKKVMTGQDIDDALREFTDKYDSPMLKRSFSLMTEGLKGGGEIADLIYRIVEDLEETRELKQEMTATNLTYVIFISFMILIITPALFTLSYQFIIIIQGFSSKLGSTGASSSIIPISFGSVSMNPDSFRDFSRYAIAVTAFFSAMVISIINTGSIKGGIKYIPAFVIGALLMHTLMIAVSVKLFSGLFG